MKLEKRQAVCDKIVRFLEDVGRQAISVTSIGYYCNLQAERCETAVDTVKVVERHCEDVGYIDARHWEGKRFTTFSKK
jgi:hypothetical protein